MKPFPLHRRLDIALRSFVLAAVALLITAVSLMSGETVESDIPRSVQAYDLPFHLFVYFVLTTCAIWAAGRRENGGRDRLTLFLACSLFGAVLEILQAVLPGVNRSCTVSDFLSNTAGAALAAALFPVRLLLPRGDTPSASK